MTAKGETLNKVEQEDRLSLMSQRKQLSYLCCCRSHGSCSRDASLDRYVTARCCHGNCSRGGEEGRDHREGKKPWTVVAIDNGRGTAMVGSSIVEDRRTDVSALPRCPVVPLEAVVVA